MPLAYLATFIEICIRFMGMKVMDHIEARILMFTRSFYKPKPMRTLEEIRADIVKLEKVAEGLLQTIFMERESI